MKYQKDTNTPIKDALVRISKIIYSGQFNEFAEGEVVVQYKTDENGNKKTQLRNNNPFLHDNVD